jgi:hypothetical protein
MPLDDTVHRTIEKARKECDRSARLFIECLNLKAACQESWLRVAKTLSRIDKNLLKDLMLEDRLAKAEHDDSPSTSNER